MEMSNLTRRNLNTALVAILCLVAAVAHAAAPVHMRAGAHGALPEGVTASDWTGIRAAYQAHRHAARATEDGFEARNPGQQWRSQFDRRGFVVQPEHGAWRWGLALERYGFAGAERRVKEPSRVVADGQRVVYHWDGTVEEWFVNDERGLEHGFTVRERPGRKEGDGSSLTFDLAVRGELRPQVAGDGTSITFVDAEGGAAVTYSTLKVWDADGKMLPARFEQPVRGDSPGIRLAVDERGARYPITVDPIAQQAYLKASNVDANDQFGYSVAISGDTAVVAARGEDSNATGVDGNQSDDSASSAGAVYVFVRSGTTWIQQAYLKASNTETNDQLAFP